MNSAIKLKLANAFTSIVAVLVASQAMITSPPLTTNGVLVLSTIITYAIMAMTAWKQALSPEISNTALRLTIATAIAATIAGLGDLLNIVHISTSTAAYIKWGISIFVMIINILSKSLFPSDDQKDRVFEMKKQ